MQNGLSPLHLHGFVFLYLSLKNTPFLQLLVFIEERILIFCISLQILYNLIDELYIAHLFQSHVFLLKILYQELICDEVTFQRFN